jgi:hypothetical protein
VNKMLLSVTFLVTTFVTISAFAMKFEGSGYVDDLETAVISDGAVVCRIIDGPSGDRAGLDCKYERDDYKPDDTEANIKWGTIYIGSLTRKTIAKRVCYIYKGAGSSGAAMSCPGQ